MGIIGQVRRSFVRVKENWSDYFKSMLILQGIRVIIVLPLLSFIFYKMLSKAGVVGITNENFLEIVRSPVALLLALVLLLVFVFFVFYELGYYFVLANKQMRQEKISFMSITLELNRKARFFLSIHSLLLVGYFLLILPIVSVGLNPELTASIKIPDFIVDELVNTQSGQIIYWSVLVVLFYIALRLLYSVCFFVLEKDLTIWQSLKKSWQESKGQSLRNFLLLAVITIGYGLLVTGGLIIIMLPLVIVEKFVPVLAPLVAGLTITAIQVIVFLVGGLLQPIIANAILEASQKDKTLQTKPEKVTTKRASWSKSYPKLIVIGSLILVGVIGFNMWSMYRIVYLPQTQIIAHRGFMEKGVENSIGGLEASAEVGADFVELDIQETKDQQFVVMHDYNLKRLASVNKEVRNLTLKELESLTIKQSGYSDHIPSLQEFIKVAKANGIKLLIEVKPHGYETPEMAENLVALLKKEKVDKEFLVQSLEKDVLDEIKAIAPEIKTGYIIPLNLGSLPESEHDFYVLEEFSVSDSTLAEAEEMGKEVFVWTINKDELLKKYLRLDVDGIITNHPDRALTMRESQEDTKNFFNRIQFLLEE